MKSCNKIKKICRAVAAWQLVFVLALQGPGFPGMPCPEAVLAADEPFLLDLDYILSYEQEQCSDMIFFGDSRVVGMSWSAGAYHYVGKGATGYYWMSSEG